MARPTTPLSRPIPDIETVAADWITRCDAGLTSAEQQVFQDWLAGDPRHAEAYDRLYQAWSVFDRVQERGSISAVLDGLAARAKARHTRRLRVVATAAVLLLGGLVYSRWPAAPSVAATAPVLAISPQPNPVRRLPDGSVVELNAGAEIAVHYEATARRVTLVKGEAFFRVAKDASRPFYVEANGVVVRAVGTAFSVQMQKSAVEIFVKEGAVDVGRTVPPVATRDPAAVRVNAGKRFVALTKLVMPKRPAAAPAAPAASAPVSTTVVAMPEPQAVSEEEMERRLAWRDTLLEFNGTTLAEAAEQLNQRNLTRILIEDEAVGRQRVTGYFRADNPEGFVRMVKNTFTLRAEVREDHTIVLRAQP
jgi:transmembrane sensor